MIKRLQVWVPAGAVGEFSSPELTLCADSYSVSILPLCYHDGTWKDLGHSAKVQVVGFTQTCIQSWPNRAGVGWMLLRHNVGTGQGKWAHMQLAREFSATVISTCWTTVDWSWPKEWNCCAWADLRLRKKKKKAQAEIYLTNLPKNPHMRGNRSWDVQKLNNWIILILIFFGHTCV